jgi:hypothetical protein
MGACIQGHGPSALVRRAAGALLLTGLVLTAAPRAARAQAPTQGGAPPAAAQAPGATDLPSTGLVHEAVRRGPRGGTIMITVGVQSDLAFDRLVLAYRPDGDGEFRGREMKPVPSDVGTYQAEIPSQGTVGPTVAYYIEAQDKGGAPVAGFASAQSPLVIDLGGPPPTATVIKETAEEEEDEEGPPGRRFFVGLLLGSGAGWTTGNGDTNADTMIHPAGFALARLGQFAPELGYWLSPALMVSLQGRFQAIIGTNDVHSGGRVYHGANYAAAGFIKATWLAGGKAGIHPFFSLAAGGGQIRHVVTFKSLNDCGSTGNQVCVDTIAAGPVAVGPGGGVMADLSPHLAAELQVNTQLTFPAFTFNVDANVGVALRF